MNGNCAVETVRDVSFWSLHPRQNSLCTLLGDVKRNCVRPWTRCYVTNTYCISYKTFNLFCRNESDVESQGTSFGITLGSETTELPEVTRVLHIFKSRLISLIFYDKFERVTRMNGTNVCTFLTL